MELFCWLIRAVGDKGIANSIDWMRLPISTPLLAPFGYLTFVYNFVNSSYDFWIAALASNNNSGFASCAKSFKFLILFLIIFGSAYSQSEKVELKNSVYNYLQRLQTKGIIERYSNASLPLTRAKITEYIKYLYSNTDKLSETELKTLNDLINEFNYDISKNDSCETELFQSGNFFSNFSRFQATNGW